MATVAPSTTTGQGMYEDTIAFRDHDDALDRKEGGSEVAEDTELSATYFVKICDLLRWMRAIMWAYLATLTLTPAAESSDNIDVTIQVKNTKAAADLEEERILEVWLADTATGWECATAPTGGISVQTGVAADVATAGKRIRVITDATGTAVIRVTESGAKSFFVRVREASKVFTQEITFA